MGLWAENPVLVKEMRTRLRARRPSRSGRFAALVVVGAVVLLLYYFGVRAIVRSTGTGAADIYGLFTVGLELTLVLFLVPSLAAGAITQEREQQTWNALLLSRLTSAQIVTGKLLAALLPTLLVLLLFLPLNLLAAWFAQMPVAAVVLSHLLLYADAVFFTSLSLFFSWAFRRTYVATTATFAAVAFFVVGTYILFFLWTLSVNSNTSLAREEAFWPVWLNPYRALVWVVDGGNRLYGPAWFALTFCILGSILLNVVVIRRLGSGPKEMEQ